MLLSTDGLKEFHLEAKDGGIGSVEDLYFDDLDWTARYLVVSTGSWISGKSVLLSPHSFGKPDLKSKVIPVSLTRAQIQDAPDPGMHKPVSRQFEADYYDFYGYPYYWQGPFIWGVAGFPSYPALAGMQGNQVAADAYRPSASKEEETPGDLHLRSAKEVRGYHVAALDGDIGHIQDFLLDRKDWSLRYLAIDTRNWLPGKHVVVPIDWARNIRYSDRKITLDHSRETIRNAPEYSGAENLTPEFHRMLDSYFEVSHTGA
ncbi:MAG: PRC-barrel domain-containing protein [Fibrobacterota bacterium]|nr:PRC-barrel domain-containing protein [Fibrobacterota bacterium]